MSNISTLRLSDWIAKDKSPEETERQERISELLSFLSVPENPDEERFAQRNAIPSILMRQQKICKVHYFDAIDVS